MDLDYATDAEIAHEQGWDYPDPATEMRYAAEDEMGVQAPVVTAPDEDDDGEEISRWIVGLVESAQRDAETP